MESGNSSSIQSSSGGDDEYDSRADSISSFLSPPSRVGLIASYHHQPPPPPSASSLDSLSAYLDAFSRTPPLVPNSDPVINCTGIVGPAGSAAATATAPYAFFPTQICPSQRPYVGDINMGPLPSPFSLSQRPPEQPPTGAAAPSPPRGSKKRLRASRRAPTTVLATDTSNFRAMVQEFTGVPSPPFPSPAFSRPRLDLLCSRPSGAGRSTGMPDAMPGYLLRPFAQKAPVPFASGFSSASSSACAIIGVSGSAGNVSTTATSAAGAASSTGADASMTGAPAAAATASSTSVTDSTSTSTTNSHHLPTDVGLGSRPQSLLLSMFNFQSFLPLSSAAKHNNSPNAPNHGMATSPQLSAEAAAAYGIGDDGGDRGHASAAHLSTLLPCFAASEGLPSSRGGGDAGRDDVLRWFEGSGAGTDGEDRGQFRPTGGSCKLNCTGSVSSDYHPEKGSDNVPAGKGEGMVDSWICSSD